MDVLYGGQRWYEQYLKGKSDRAAAMASSRLKPLLLMDCFNIEKPDHAAKDCPTPCYKAKQASRRKEYRVKHHAQRAAVTQVLYELCGQHVELSGERSGNDRMNDADVRLAACGTHLIRL